MKTILEDLFSGKTLSSNEAEEILTKIAHGEYNNSQIASFLTFFQLRPIKPGELSGFRNALLNLCVKIDLSEFNSIDLCGTGGDNKNTFNISTLSSFLVAGAGYKVTKHGNYGASSVSGSSNILEYFGCKFTNDNDKLRNQLEKTNICFLHAPLFHPAMKTVAPIRKELGFKTFFNLSGPIVNPARPKNQIVGVYNNQIAELYSEIFLKLDLNYSIVHSISGYDEISLTSGFRLLTRYSDSIIQPEEINLKTINENEITAGISIEDSAEIFIDILIGNGTDAQNNVVLINTAYALQTINNEPIDKCFEEAKKSLFDKKALNSFNKLIKISK